MSRFKKFSAWAGRWPKPTAQVLLELFVAISLTVNFFYLVKAQCLPQKRNGALLPAVTFCWLSPNFHVSASDVPGYWRTRVAAPALSSWLAGETIMSSVDDQSDKYKNLLEVCQSAEFQRVFGFYHAGWLFLTFLTLICFRADALLIIMGVFGGLMYNLIEPAGAYYYPWDLSTLFFFTLACLLFDRGWIWPLLPVVWLGGLVKETTLCCALFILLGTHWNWKKRVFAFLAVVAVTFATNRLLLSGYGVRAPLLVMNNAATLGDLFRNTHVPENIRFLFSRDLNHVLFANAGALCLMMLVPWRSRRDVLFKLVIVVFALGQFLYGVINEFRIWYELLPVGWILVSDAVTRQWQSFRGGTVGVTDPEDRRRAKTYWLALGLLLAVLVAGWVVTKLTVPPPFVETRSDDEVMRAKIAAAEGGDVAVQFDLGMIYQNRMDHEEAMRWFRRAAELGHADSQYCLAMILSGLKHDYPAAAEWFRKAAEQGHPRAEYNLGVLYWNGLTGQADHQEGFKWLRQAAVHGELRARQSLGQIFMDPPADFMRPNRVEAYKWLKLAYLGGLNTAEKELQACAAGMTPEQIAEAEAWVDQVGRKPKP